jgi:hypothetical protein
MQVKYLKTKAGVRSLCVVNRDTLICGENEGWIDVIRITEDYRTLEIVISKKFDKLGHIYQIQTTS